jgi:Fe2+ or Zn2+ uptake regulation protein
LSIGDFQYQDDGTAPRYTHDIAMAECKHTHLVCKDCGTTIKRKEERSTCEIAGNYPQTPRLSRHSKQHLTTMADVGVHP